jgi:hypothetical protein
VPWRRLLLGALLVAGCAGTTESTPPGKEATPLVVLISIGGFTPGDLAASAGAPPLLPTVARFAEHGARAFRVTPVTPASTYPTHASLVTGVRPAKHGIVADRQLGGRGVSRIGYGAASALRAVPLWQLAAEAALRVAALDWPTTEGAAIAQLLPDVTPGADGSWLERLRASAPTEMIALAQQHGGDAPGVAAPGRQRDAVLVGVACDLVASPRPPQLLLLRLSQTSAALRDFGPGSREALEAFAGADRELERFLRCLRDANALESASVFVVGDYGFGPVHTAIAPNVALAQARLLTPQAGALASWEAVVRSNGGSAFVYAKSERAALRAREVLDREAGETGGFRVLSADELLKAGADPSAWFGLEAQPGYAFEDAATGELLRAAAARGVGGYVSAGPGLAPGFAAWGRGIRRGIRIPVMRQTDVAPTLARLLGLAPPGDAEGRALVGVLEPAAPKLPETASPPPAGATR